MKGKLFAVRCIPCVCFLLCFHAKTRGEGGMSRARCEKKASCKAMGILYPRTFGTVSCYASTPSTPSPASRSARLFVCVFYFLLSLRTLSLWTSPVSAAPRIQKLSFPVAGSKRNGSRCCRSSCIYTWPISSCSLPHVLFKITRNWCRILLQ